MSIHNLFAHVPLSETSWDTFLFSEHTSVGVIDGIRVVMKKPALGAGLLVRVPKGRPRGESIGIDRSRVWGADVDVVRDLLA